MISSLNFRMRYLLTAFSAVVLVISFLSTSSPAVDLTIERMYSDPRLTGITPGGTDWSPDGRYLAFRWNDQGNRYYDIWLYDARRDKLTRATDAAALSIGAGAELTRAEIDRLATLRRSGGGIFSFHWSPDGKRILFPLKGDLYLLEVPSLEVRPLFRTASSETDPRFSPGGERVAFVRENDIWMMELESGKMVQLTSNGSEELYNGLGDYVDYEEVGRSSGFWWSPQGDRIAYIQTDVSPVRPLLVPNYLGKYVEARKQLRPVAGGENSLQRIGILSLDSEETVWIEPEIRRDEYFVAVKWHPSGEELLMLCEPRNLKQVSFLKVNPDNGSHDTLLTVRDDKWVNIHNMFLRWDEEGDNLYFTSEDSGWNHIYGLDWSGGDTRQLTEGDWEVTALHNVDEDGRIWFTATAIEPQQRHLFRLEEDGNMVKVTPGEGWYHSYISDDTGRAAVLYSNLGKPYDLYLLESLDGTEDWKQRSVVPEHRLEPGRRAGTGVEPDSEEDEGSNQGDRWKPAPVMVSDFHRPSAEMPDNLKPVAGSEREDLDSIHIPVPRYFTITSRLDGEIVHALMILPPGLEDVDLESVVTGETSREFDKEYPAIITVHGGGYSQSVTGGWRWRALYDTYLSAGKGYVILDLDYRGSSGYGRKFRTDVYLDIGNPDVEDEITGLEFLWSLPFIDPDRVGMWGWSYGGYMTAMAMLKYPEAFHAGAGVAPVTEWKNYDTHYTEERLGMPCRQKEAYRRGSPVSYAGYLKNHLLLIHGVGDDNVHFQDTVLLVDKMIESGVDFEVMFYPGSRHGIRADDKRIHLFRKITRHFERYMKGIPDASCP